MALRILNLHSQPLHIDLRGGQRLVLASKERSRALPEELLYDNQYIAEWERVGWLQRIPARMSEVGAEEIAPPPDAAGGKPARKSKPGASRPASSAPRAAAATKPGKKSRKTKSHPK